MQHFTKLSKPKKSSVYNNYWHFAHKRNDIFYKRIINPIGPWTDDPVIKKHRFTNVFRASDRVSQFLIDLQYRSDYSHKDIFFITILFKIFNKIETFKYLEKEIGEVSYSSFSFEKYDSALTKRMAGGRSIYSAAYIMPSASSYFGYKFKHTNHLALLSKMMDDGLYERIAQCKSLEQVYTLLLSYPSLGRFLAFQYAIDLNYSTIINFSEMEYVVAGPGAKNGILKCFESLGDYSFEDIIKYMSDNQEHECHNLEIPSLSLFGRSLQLIDCQNLFCEVDKYLRATNPELSIKSGKSRIKQKFTQAIEPVCYFFPPKWNINNQIINTCSKKTIVDIFS